MKKVSMFMLCLVFALGSSANDFSFAVATDKTLSFIFPFSIRHVDCGTTDVVFEVIETADSILLVKAAKANFASTNMTVVTAEGGVYSIALFYQANPSIVNYHFDPQHHQTLRTYCYGILDNQTWLRGVKGFSWGIDAKVTGIYIKGSTLFYHVVIKNMTPIDYDVEMLRVYIRDKKQSKRTAQQEVDIIPLLVVGNVNQIKAEGQTSVVMAVDKFTIPNKKNCWLELKEKSGGRHLALRIKNNHLLAARPLPELQ